MLDLESTCQYRCRRYFDFGLINPDLIEIVVSSVGANADVQKVASARDKWGSFIICVTWEG